MTVRAQVEVPAGPPFYDMSISSPTSDRRSCTILLPAGPCQKQGPNDVGLLASPLFCVFVQRPVKLTARRHRLSGALPRQLRLPGRPADNPPGRPAGRGAAGPRQLARDRRGRAAGRPPSCPHVPGEVADDDLGGILIPCEVDAQAAPGVARPGIVLEVAIERQPLPPPTRSRSRHAPCLADRG